MTISELPDFAILLELPAILSIEHEGKSLSLVPK